MLPILDSEISSPFPGIFLLSPEEIPEGLGHVFKPEIMGKRIQFNMPLYCSLAATARILDVKFCTKDSNLRRSGACSACFLINDETKFETICKALATVGILSGEEEILSSGTDFLDSVSIFADTEQDPFCKNDETFKSSLIENELTAITMIDTASKRSGLSISQNIGSGWRWIRMLNGTLKVIYKINFIFNILSF